MWLDSFIALQFIFFSLKVLVQSWCHSSKQRQSTLFCSVTRLAQNLHFAALSSVCQPSLWCSLSCCTAWVSRSTILTHARCWLVLCFRVLVMHSWCGVQLATSSLVLLHLPLPRCSAGYLCMFCTHKPVTSSLQIDADVIQVCQILHIKCTSLWFWQNVARYSDCWRHILTGRLYISTKRCFGRKKQCIAIVYRNFEMFCFYRCDSLLKFMPYLLF